MQARFAIRLVALRAEPVERSFASTPEPDVAVADEEEEYGYAEDCYDDCNCYAGWCEF